MAGSRRHLLTGLHGIYEPHIHTHGPACVCRIHRPHLAPLCPPTGNHGIPTLVHLRELAPFHHQSVCRPASPILDPGIRNPDEIMDLLHRIRLSLRSFLDGPRSSGIPAETASPESASGQKTHLSWLLIVLIVQVLLMFSRVILGMHSFNEVLLGATLGLFSIAVYYLYI